MGHPEIDNLTPFAFAPLFLSDEDGRPLVVPIVKATFDIGSGGEIELSRDQIPVDFTGRHYGEPGASSYLLEPETAFFKPATDVVVIGHAYAPARRATSVDVGVRVGGLARELRVTGDRVWTRRFLGYTPSPAKPFEKLPVVYERAYGGWDRSLEDPEQHTFHPENPVGVGYRNRKARFEEGAPLPNVEDPRTLLTSYRGKSRSAGLGFTSPHWEPRRLLAGTFGEDWERSRMPLLPRDFDRRFFNAASEGLVARGYLRGDERTEVRGMSPGGRISFQLPGIESPSCVLSLRGRSDESVPTQLDTVIMDLESRNLILIWRGYWTLQGGPLDVLAIEISVENAPMRYSASDNVISLPRRHVA